MWERLWVRSHLVATRGIVGWLGWEGTAWGRGRVGVGRNPTGTWDGWGWKESHGVMGWLEGTPQGRGMVGVGWNPTGTWDGWKEPHRNMGWLGLEGIPWGHGMVGVGRNLKGTRDGWGWKEPHRVEGWLGLEGSYRDPIETPWIPLDPIQTPQRPHRFQWIP